MFNLLGLMPTNQAYDTHGGLDKEGKLVDYSKSWTITEQHKEMLRGVWKKHKGNSGTAFNKVLILDQTIRTKQARGFKWCMFISMLDQTGIHYSLEDPHKDE